MKRHLLQLGAVLSVLLLLAAIWVFLDYRGFLVQPLHTGADNDIIVIKPGSSMRAVADQLQRQGIVTQPRYLVWRARQRGIAAKIRAGEYQVSDAISVDQLLDRFVSGEVIHYYLTLVEGWNFHEVRMAIAQSPYLKHTLDGLSDAEIMVRLGKAEEHPEGRFFPDTYAFPRGTLDVVILQRAYQTMVQHLQQEWQQRDPDLPLETPYEALILASIIEKETGLAAERSDIAGVFIRRLQKGMRLQTDPTVIYGMGDNYDGNIRRRDLRQDTPYNTYTRRGLPPTPIAMPGLASIRAALHPAPGKTLYFVGKGDGSHHFSETLDEHNRAVIKYQLHGKRRTFSSMPGKKQ
jgi:UPF0755 protein